MRQTAASNNGQFRLKVVAGTRTVLMALDCDEARREGLLGFSFYRARQGAANSGKWLRSQKVFKSLVPNPRKKVNGRPPVFTTANHPVQSFLWGDYTAEPGATYEFRIVPAYGRPGALRHEADDEITISVTTELENDPRGHGVWFNRGAIASQHFAREFGDVEPSSQQLEDLTQPVTKWLSRGLAEACLDFINEIPEGEGLRCCLYEFTYKPVLNALKAAIDRGVDVRICFHGTEVNRKAVAAAELRKKVGNVQVLFERTVPKIPHNKFMVRLDKRGQPQSIWTGSTNITSSGFLGQSNVGHRINRHPKLAAKFLEYWEAISKDPKSFPSKEASTKVSPHPVEDPKEGSITPVFSPRHTAGMLQWYANRMVDATQGVMFTAAFGVNEKFVLPLADDRDFLRFVLMEKRPKKDLEDRLRDDRDLVISYGSVLGEAAFIKDGKREVRRIRKFGLDRWFEREEHYRKSGNVFFVHTKFLLVDPLSDDPLVCSGSANFSDNSLKQNDENMLLIRGDTRVADIYLTEFDRIFRHFYFRDVANEIEVKGGTAKGAFLEEDDGWTDPYFKPGAFKTRRREMFFSRARTSWADNAAQRAWDETAGTGDQPTAQALQAAGRKTPSAPSRKSAEKTSAAKRVVAKRA